MYDCWAGLGTCNVINIVTLVRRASKMLGESACVGPLLVTKGGGQYTHMVGARILFFFDSESAGHPRPEPAARHKALAVLVKQPAPSPRTDSLMKAAPLFACTEVSGGGSEYSSYHTKAIPCRSPVKSYAVCVGIVGRALNSPRYAGNVLGQK